MRTLVLCAFALSACSQESGLNRILRPPTVVIENPLAGDEVRKGAPVTFEGTVNDTFDVAESMTITWSIGDLLAVAPSRIDDDRVFLELDLELLPLGEHTLQLSAVDSDDQEGVVGVPFFVNGAISAPTVQITAPETGSLFGTGEEITFRGTAEDNNTDPGDLKYTWRSDIDGVLPGALSGDDGTTALFTQLSAGTHLVSLEVSDSDDEVGIDTITVSVGDIIEPAQPGDVIFSELMINPNVVADDIGEWVELYNTAGYAIDVGGYTFRDDDVDRFTLEGPLIVAPGDYIVLCANTDASVNGGVPCDGPFKRKTAGALALANSVDEVILETPSGTVIDRVVYDRSWYSVGVAIGVDPEKLDGDNNDSESDWCDQTTVISTGGEPGTPGRPNDPC